MAVLARLDVWAERRRRVGELRARHRFARQVLDFYGALLGVQESAFHDARTAAPGPESFVAYAAEMVVPGVVDATVAAAPDRLRKEVLQRMETVDVPDVLRAYIESEAQPAVDRYLARASLGPMLEALGADVRACCAGPRDPRHCPDCGGPPQLSVFTVAPDDLATGPRQLLCARCGTAWGYARMTCAGCGEESSARLSVFGEEGTTSGERGSVVRGLPGGPAAQVHRPVFPNVRIEACDTCRTYLLSVDLAADRAAVPFVDELSAIPLDLYARDRGFRKITPNLLGF